MLSRLVVLNGRSEGQVHTFAERMTIGRHRNNGLVLEDSTLSRHHVELIPGAEGCVLRDLGSRHGTFVNQKRVSERVLQHGDSIQIGSSMLLYLRGGEEPQTGAGSLGSTFEMPLSAGNPETIGNAETGEATSSSNDHGLLGDSAAIVRLRALIDRVARADAAVLLHGESGSGKELVARAIHRASRRAAGPWVVVNCATLTENLLESELFGHEKGAFTGAAQRRLGKFEIASKGTLFLDEIAEIPLALQAKLLRALQEGEIERLGGDKPIQIDVRVIAASHRDLAKMCQAGTFREDLYYRLNVVALGLPPLRERSGDVVLLAKHFARECAERLGLPQLELAAEARDALLAFPWPGNVRQLANVIERAAVLGDGRTIRREDLPDEVLAASSENAGAFQKEVVEAKKQSILMAWRESGNDYQKTAELLGIHVNSLHRLVRQLDLKSLLFP